MTKINIIEYSVEFYQVKTDMVNFTYLQLKLFKNAITCKGNVQKQTCM